MAMVLMFVGWTGAAFNQDMTAEAEAGQSFRAGNYDLKLREIKGGDNETDARILQDVQAADWQGGHPPPLE